LDTAKLHFLLTIVDGRQWHRVGVAIRVAVIFVLHQLLVVAVLAIEVAYWFGPWRAPVFDRPVVVAARSVGAAFVWCHLRVGLVRAIAVDLRVGLLFYPAVWDMNVAVVAMPVAGASWYWLRREVVVDAIAVGLLAAPQFASVGDKLRAVVARLVDAAFEQCCLAVAAVRAFVADLHPAFDLDGGAMFAVLWLAEFAT